MMKMLQKQWIAATALLTAATIAAAPAAAQQVAPDQEAGPALWKITDEDSTVWVFGSVHLLDPAIEWRRPMLAEALEAADVVYFEAPTDYMAQLRAAAIIAETGVNPPGQTLSGLLTPEEAGELSRIADELNISLAQLDQMRPWLAVMMMSAAMAQQTGAAPEAGVDALLLVDALRARKEVRYFESIEQQIGFFADLPDDAQILMLKETLRQYDDVSSLMDGMVAAWLRGDVEQLGALIMESVAEGPDIFYNTLFLYRNQAWAEELEQLMQGDGVVLVVVGAGHMIGQDSLILMMESRGYQIEKF